MASSSVGRLEHDDPYLREVLTWGRWIVLTRGRSLLDGGPFLGTLDRPHSGMILTWGRFFLGGV